MLTKETFVPSIKHLEQHLIHIGYQEYLSIYGHALETEETVVN
jgi:hypothetical protein